MQMKQLTYAYDDNFAWNRSYFALAANKLGLDFVGGWQINQRYRDGGWNPDVRGPMTDIEDREQRERYQPRAAEPDGIYATGRNEQSHDRRRRALYNALCQGVPAPAFYKHSLFD